MPNAELRTFAVTAARANEKHPPVVNAAGKSVREINREIRDLVASGCREIEIQEPAAQHNLGVGIVEPVALRFGGSVGYYCGGMGDGPDVTIQGSAGWGVGEGILSGSVVVEGNAGNGAGAAIRGGTVVVKGDAGARAGVSIKGGTLIVGGSCGYMTGFMGQKGTIVVCGDTEEALGDSMYETVLFVGGEIGGLGTDTEAAAASAEELCFLRAALAPYGLPVDRDWKRVVSGRKMWNFDKHEAVWREIL
jgi:glutamate synthase domain-containing protein 3